MSRQLHAAHGSSRLTAHGGHMQGTHASRAYGFHFRFGEGATRPFLCHARNSSMAHPFGEMPDPYALRMRCDSVYVVGRFRMSSTAIRYCMKPSRCSILPPTSPVWMSCQHTNTICAWDAARGCESSDGPRVADLPRCAAPHFGCRAAHHVLTAHGVCRTSHAFVHATSRTRSWNVRSAYTRDALMHIVMHRCVEATARGCERYIAQLGATCS